MSSQPRKSIAKRSHAPARKRHTVRSIVNNSRMLIGASFFDPFPPKLRRTFVYADYIQISSSGSTAFLAGTQVTFNLNSLFAPRTSGGHQPYGFDQISPLYAKYKVLSVKCTITILANKVTSYNTGLCVVLQPANGGLSLTGSDCSLASEKPGCTLYHADTSARNHATNIPIATIEGIGKLEFAADIEDYSALCSASPAKVPTMAIAAFANEAVADKIDLVVRMEYTAEVYDRIIQASS